MMGMKLGLVIESLYTFGYVYVLSLCGIGGTYFSSVSDLRNSF